MVRARWHWLKHLLYAVCVLLVLCCLEEVALRVYDSTTCQLTRKELYDRGLLCKSWFVHHSLKPSLTFQAKNADTGESVRLAINGFGLRGAEPAVPKPPGTLRIMCLGDETTLGMHFTESVTFCGRLRDLLQAQTRLKVEVLNGGVPDYCPLLSYLQLKHQLLGLQPDLVILNFDMSDIAEDYRYRRFTTIGADGQPLSCLHPALELPRQQDTKPWDRMFLTPRFAQRNLQWLWAERLLNHQSRSIECSEARYLWLEEQAPDWGPYIEQALLPVAQLRDLAAGVQAEMLFAIHPAPWQVSADASSGPHVRERAGVPDGAHYQSRQPFVILADFCRAHEIRFVDASPAFLARERPQELYMRQAPVLSALGHELYAAELARAISEGSRLFRAVGPGSGPAPPPRSVTRLPRSTARP